MTAKVWGAGRRRRAAKLRKPRTADRALRILAAAPAPMTAGELGDALWKDATVECKSCGGEAYFDTVRGDNTEACRACKGTGRMSARRGRVASVNGGGDYAAQMLLGRLRKAGLVRVLPWDGASRWGLTEEGQKAAIRAALDRLGGELRQRACDCGGTPPCVHT